VPGKRVIIEMEDLTHSVIRPCLMDIKMGQRTFVEAEASATSLRSDLLDKMLKVDSTAATAEERKAGGITKMRYLGLPHSVFGLFITLSQPTSGIPRQQLFLGAHFYFPSGIIFLGSCPHPPPSGIPRQQLLLGAHSTLPPSLERRRRRFNLPSRGRAPRSKLGVGVGLGG
jgi:hypothetical protein